MKWYYIDAGSQVGPISEEELKALVKAGKITDETLSWHEGLSDWQQFGKLKPGAAGSVPAGSVKWYYVEAGNRVGPISEKEMRGLVKTGKVTSETMVWRKELPDWQKFGTLASNLQEPVLSDSSLKTTIRETVCSECGRPFSQEEMIRYEDSWICPDCKPVFLQKLKEGVQVSGTMNYGGFWIRFGAKFIDWIILSAVNILISFVGGMFIAFDTNMPLIVGTQIFLALLNVAIAAGYATWFVGKYGATPGKMACKLKVITAEGGKVSYARACGRYFAEILSGMILMIGYIMAAFDEEKRTLHDRICDTRVVATEKG